MGAVMDKTWVFQDDEQKRTMVAQSAELAGLPDALPATIEQLSDKWDARILEIVLYSLLSGETPRVEKRGDVYHWIGPRTDGIVLHALEMQRRWLQLPEVLKTGKPSGTLEPWFLDILTSTMRTSAIKLMPAIRRFVEHTVPPQKGVQGIDVGGSHGLFSEALEFSGYHMSVLDLPHVVKIANQQNPGMRYIAHDVLKDGPVDVGPGLHYDFALMVRFIHMHSLEGIHRIAENLLPALADDGQLLIVDTFRGLSPNSDTFAVNMAVNTPGGGTYTIDEVAQALAPHYKLERYELWSPDDLSYVETVWKRV